MSDYWKMYWDQHAENVTSDDPFRQVLRVQNKQPQTQEMFLTMVSDIGEKLELEADHRVLDLCCGNGLITTEIARRARYVVGVDFSEKLVQGLKRRAPKNVTALVGNAMGIKFKPGSFDRILMAAALQHFSHAQIIQLFKDFMLWLEPGGILLVTDILDVVRIWNFFNTTEREDIYFQNTMEETPVLGTWLDPVWLEKLARYAGFSEAIVLSQSDDYWYAHYRFDLHCRK